MIGMGKAGVWACCNVGASKPEDYGSYFAWGETETKSEYYYKNYEHRIGTTYDCVDIGSDIGGNNKYDAATKNWGSSWRMPSNEQIENLIDHCGSVWIKLNGVEGRLFISIDGNKLFFPATGYHQDDTSSYIGYSGYCWSSMCVKSFSSYAYQMVLGVNNSGKSYTERYYGLPVRPVRQ